MDKKKLRNDLILILSLLIVAVIALVVVLTTRKKANTTATVYVRSEVVLKIDLNRDDEHYYVDGVHTKVHIHVKDNAIAIVESGCPHQDCVLTGYVKDTNRPIICAYNAVTIIIEGTSEYDVVIG